jgi:hypothetical protein
VVDKELFTFDELDSELALELPERKLLQCNNNQGLICISIGNVCVGVSAQVLASNPVLRNAVTCTA